MSRYTSFECVSCKELFSQFRCDGCNGLITSRCEECHKEKMHGEIPKPKESRAGVPQRNLYKDADGDEGNDNAIRALEDRD